MVFGTGWYAVPDLSFAIHAASMRLAGDDLLGLRLASALEGIASVLALYLLGRRLWGARTALVAAALLAMAAWHIQFSRTGFHYMQALLSTLLALYFLVRGVQARRALDWMLCGLALGLSLEVYYAGRLAPVLVAVYLGYCALSQRGFARTHGLGVLAMLFAAGVFLAPMGAVYARNPSQFTSRTEGVLVLEPDNLQHELEAYHVQTLRQVLAIQVQRTLEAFNSVGETSLQYEHPAPLLDFWTGGLLAMAAIGVLLRSGSPREVLLSAWVWLGLLLGSVLTVDALFSPRVLPVLPGLVLAAAIMLEHAWRGVERVWGGLGARVFTLPVLGLLGLALLANVHDYFDVQVTQRQPADRFTLLARYAEAVNGSYRLYVIGRPDFSLASETPRFLDPAPDAVDVRDAPLSLPLAEVPPDKGVAFVVETEAADSAQRLDAIRSAYPQGTKQTIAAQPGQAVFTSYLVDHAELVAAARVRYDSGSTE